MRKGKSTGILNGYTIKGLFFDAENNLYQVKDRNATYSFSKELLTGLKQFYLFHEIKGDTADIFNWRYALGPADKKKVLVKMDGSNFQLNAINNSISKV